VYVPVFKIPVLKRSQSAKSLLGKDFVNDIVGDMSLAAVIERFRSETPPLSLQELREQRAANKVIRKNCIKFLRKRTAIRLAKLEKQYSDDSGNGTSASKENDTL
jgi:hypothetical protein